MPRLSEEAIDRVVLWLALTVGLLTIAGLISVFLNPVRIDDFYLAEVRESFVRLFRLDGEANVPTWFSSSMLLAGAALTARIAMTGRKEEAPFWRHWTALACICAFMSLDETAMIHEMLGRPTRHLLNLDGALYFSWILPVSIVGLFLLVGFARFLRNLPDRTRWLFLCSGLIFVAGAMGMEAVSALYWSRTGDSIAYGVATTAEEFLEMAGIVIFLKALMEFPPLYDTSEPA